MRRDEISQTVEAGDVRGARKKKTGTESGRAKKVKEWRRERSKGAGLEMWRVRSW